MQARIEIRPGECPQRKRVVTFDTLHCVVSSMWEEIFVRSIYPRKRSENRKLVRRDPWGGKLGWRCCRASHKSHEIYMGKLQRVGRESNISGRHIKRRKILQPPLEICGSVYSRNHPIWPLMFGHLSLSAKMSLHSLSGILLVELLSSRVWGYMSLGGKVERSPAVQILC